MQYVMFGDVGLELSVFLWTYKCLANRMLGITKVRWQL